MPECGDSVTEYEMTTVKFRPLSDESILRYVETGEPMGKAGAYAIQGIGGLLVESIAGDYNCVVGLPLGRLASMLRKFGLCSALRTPASGAPRRGIACKKMQARCDNEPSWF